MGKKKGGLGGFLTGITGADAAAKAAGRAAQAQERAAREQLAFARQNQERAFAEAAASPQELRALEESLNAQSRNVERQSQLFDALDPAILEASGQALALLQGREAKALQPLRDQRQRERQKLVNSLREQLGPGAETSTAGIQALNQFDIATSEQLGGAQQSSLGQLFGLASTGAQNRSSLNAGTSTLANIGSQGFGGINQRRVNALLGGQDAVSGAGQDVIVSAGSQFTEAALRAQAQQQLVGGLIEAGAGASFGALMGGAGAAPKFGTIA